LLAETNQGFNSLFRIVPFGFGFITSEMLYERFVAVTILDKLTVTSLFVDVNCYFGVLGGTRTRKPAALDGRGLPFSITRTLLERVVGFEPTTASLATKYSTSELHPHSLIFYAFD